MSEGSSALQLLTAASARALNWTLGVFQKKKPECFGDQNNSKDARQIHKPLVLMGIWSFQQERQKPLSK